jgi:hypothetical protein
LEMASYTDSTKRPAKSAWPLKRSSSTNLSPKSSSQR